MTHSVRRRADIQTAAQCVFCRARFRQRSQTPSIDVPHRPHHNAPEAILPLQERDTRWYIAFRGLYMTTAEAIIQRLKSLPDSAQREVLDFVEFLESRRKDRTLRKDDVSWSDFSLASAMRGMEDEDSAYTRTDLKESFR